MEGVITKLAEQLPVAVLFAGFVILLFDRLNKILDKHDQAQAERDQMMRDFWREQQAGTREILEKLAASIDAVAEKMDLHDAKTSNAIAAMFERTSGRKSAKPPKLGEL